MSLSLSKKAKDFIKKIKIEYLIVIALGVVAIFIFSSTKTESVKTQSSTDYIAETEQKLASCLSKVKGAGRVEVIINVSGGFENVYATKLDTNADGNTTKTPLIVNGKPITIMEKYPEIKGVVIISQGASNLSVRMDLLDATTTFLGVDSNKIQILSMK